MNNKVYNNLTQEYEPGTEATCPSCGGNGDGVRAGRGCEICWGEGHVLLTASGWARHPQAHPRRSTYVGYYRFAEDL